MSNITREERHIQVAHQERYQLRKRIQHIKNHRAGLHTHKIVKCDECNPVVVIEDNKEPTKNV